MRLDLPPPELFQRPLTESAADIRLEQHYILHDRPTVVSFLDAHPSIAPLLLRLSRLIPEFFSGAPLFLRVVETAPTADTSDGRRLVLFIATALEEDHAMTQMDRLMEAWHPDARSRANEALSVGIAFGTTSAAVEIAAQRFIRTHNGDYKKHSALARRLLACEPGTAEESRALAELADSFTDDRGTSPRLGGGDARSVLARLRRQAGRQ